MTDNETPEKTIGIFWDVENIAIPRNTPTKSLVRRMQSWFEARNYRILEFMAIFDTLQFPRRVASDLDEGGVTVVQINAEGKNSSDLKIMDRMERFVDLHLRFKSPITICLISCDGDYLNTLRRLREKKVHIMLVKKNNCSRNLQDIAHETLELSEFMDSDGAPLNLPDIIHCERSNSRQSNNAIINSNHASGSANYHSGLQNQQARNFDNTAMRIMAAPNNMFAVDRRPAWNKGPKPRDFAFHARNNTYAQRVYRFCKECKVTLHSMANYKEHLKSAQHKKNTGQLLQPVPVSNDLTKRCHLCDMYFIDANQYSDHIRSAGHKRGFALLEIAKGNRTQAATEPDVAANSVEKVETGAPIPILVEDARQVQIEPVPISHSILPNNSTPNDNVEKTEEDDEPEISIIKDCRPLEEDDDVTIRDDDEEDEEEATPISSPMNSCETQCIEDDVQIIEIDKKKTTSDPWSKVGIATTSIKDIDMVKLSPKKSKRTRKLVDGFDEYLNKRFKTDPK